MSKVSSESTLTHKPSIMGDVHFYGMNYDQVLETTIYRKLREWIFNNPDYDDSLLTSYDASIQRSRDGHTIGCVIRVFMGPRAYKEMAKAPSARMAIDNCIRRLSSHQPYLTLAPGATGE